MTTQHKRFGRTLARIENILIISLLAGVPLVKAQCPPQMPATIPFFLPIPAQSGQPSQPGQQCLNPNPDGNGSYWFSLSFTQSSGVVPFGLYTYNGYGWIFHLDLGWEYLVDGTSTCTGCAYFYDLASTHWFFTSPYLFPYLSDLTLGHILWYEPDLTQPGQYTSNPRFFYDFSTNQVISLGSASFGLNYTLPQIASWDPLSINNTGSGNATLPLSQWAWFAFMYTDSNATGYQLIGSGTTMLLDSSAGHHCTMTWWSSGAFTLLNGTDDPPGDPYQLSDGFCEVFVPTISHPDGNSTMVTPEFQFFVGSPSPYSVVTQVYDTSGNYGPWEQVGTVTLAASTLPVTVAAVPAGVGLMVSVDGGGPQASPYYAQWASGSSHTITASTPQTGTDGIQYFFGGWSDGLGASHQITVTQSTLAYTAAFAEGSPTPATPSDPVYDTLAPTLPSPVSGSAQNCTDLTGTWSDPNYNYGNGNAVWTLSQAYNSISGGKLVTSTNGGICPGYVTVTRSVSGSSTQLQATSAQPASFYCYYDGYPVQIVESDISVSLTPGCSTATISREGAGSGPLLSPPQVADAMPAVAPPQNWSRSTKTPEADAAFDLAGSKVTASLKSPRSGDLWIWLQSNAHPEWTNTTNPAQGFLAHVSNANSNLGDEVDCKRLTNPY